MKLTPTRCRAAIDKGVAYLKRSQNQNGTWTEFPTGNYAGGITALCTLALLNAGVPPDDPQLRRAIEQVRNLPPEKTYVVALQTMVLCMASPKDDLLTIRRNAEWLEANQNTHAGADDPRRGSWSYGSGNTGGTGDNSNSQFALLALYEAERVGVQVPDRTWNLALQYWLGQQNIDGSWGYLPLKDRQTPGSGSMTCAGVTSVFIASGRLSAGDAEITDDGLKCCGQHEDNPAVKAMDKGFAWLGNNFSVYANPGQGSLGNWHLYYLYALERVGRMTSHRFFTRRDGQHYDWYRMGAEMLIAKQDELSGFWKGEGVAESNPEISTSFALLFLAKGRRPILISKARYGGTDNWNRHRSDVAHLTSYVESKWKKEFPLGLSWQIVDLETSSVDDLLQTPVLYISGSVAPKLIDQAKKLREYIDRGGFIFAEACCQDSAGFDAGFRQLMDQVFDEPEYRLKPVPEGHPLWIAEEPVRPGLRPNLWSIDYGCRTSVVYAAPPDKDTAPLPNGLSCYWEICLWPRSQVKRPLQEQLNAALSMGINVLAYATNRELKSKDQNFQLADEAPKDTDTFERGKRYIANIRHAGGSDAAPGALPNLLRAASRELKSRFGTQPRQVKLTDPEMFHYDVLFMHGRSNFKLTDEERKQLHKYLERGGTVIADAICANRDFAESFRREMNEVFADQGAKLEPIPATHQMFTNQNGGFDLSQVSRRVPQSRAAGAPLEAKGAQIGAGIGRPENRRSLRRHLLSLRPKLRLEKHDSLECEGYTRDDAERIGLNLVLYATFGL